MFSSAKFTKREYNNSPAVVFEGITLFHRNFHGFFINLFPIKPEIWRSKTRQVAEKLLLVCWKIVKKVSAIPSIAILYRDINSPASEPPCTSTQGRSPF